MALKPNILPLAIATLLALVLAALSLPSLIAASIALPHNGEMELLRRGTPPPPFVMVDAANANIRAARLFESGRYGADAAAALLALKSADRAATGRDVVKIVEQSLAAAPASPYNWNRLAYLRMRAGDHAGAQKAWQMSVLTGRYEPHLMNNRIELAIRLFPITDPEMIDMLIDQVRLAAEADSKGLARMAIDAGGGPFVRAVLWRDTSLAPKFDEYFTRWMRYKGWKARGK
jgi:hypothetical protein